MSEDDIWMETEPTGFGTGTRARLRHWFLYGPSWLVSMVAVALAMGLFVALYALLEWAAWGGVK